MNDTRQLRGLLFVALFGACGSPAKPTGPTEPTGSATPARPIDAAAIDAAPAAVVEVDAAVAAVITEGPPPGMNFPRCPEMKWCTKASAVAKLATKEAKDAMGCKTILADFDPETEKHKPAPKDWPMQGVEMRFDEAATKEKRDAKDKTTCCYTWIEPCPGGRALVVDGEAVTAAVPHVDEDEAARWLAEAAAEHASVASFARVMLELMAVNAPFDLLDATAVAMRDEIRHAELCLQQAARFAGHPVALGPLPAAPARAADLARLACDTFVEGCVGETVAVLVAMRRRAACADPEIARVFDTIIADETRHAALAWQTLRWAMTAGGSPVAAAVQALAVAPADATGAERDAWRDLVLPTLRALVPA